MTACSRDQERCTSGANKSATQRVQTTGKKGSACGHIRGGTPPGHICRWGGRSAARSGSPGTPASAAGTKKGLSCAYFHLVNKKDREAKTGQDEKGGNGAIRDQWRMYFLGGEENRIYKTFEKSPSFRRLDSRVQLPLI